MQNETLQKIMQAKDTADKTVTVKEWGVDVLLIEPVRSVIEGLRARYLKDVPNLPAGATEKQIAEAAGSLSEEAANDFSYACLAVMAHDVDGNTIFESMEHAKEVLSEKSALVQGKLMEACKSLVSPIDAEGVDKAEGNSGGIQS